MPAGRSAIILIMELITAVVTQVAFAEQTLQGYVAGWQFNYGGGLGRNYRRPAQ